MRAQAFRAAVEDSLADPSLSLGRLERLAPPREDGSIFVGISSFRDETCPATLAARTSRADELVRSARANILAWPPP